MMPKIGNNLFGCGGGSETCCVSCSQEPVHDVFLERVFTADGDNGVPSTFFSLAAVQGKMSDPPRSDVEECELQRKVVVLEERLRMEAEEQERRRQELDRREEESRREAQQRERDQERRRQELEAEAKKIEDERVFRIWMERQGFKDVNEKRKTLFFSFTYPLHVAVQENNADIVRMLVAAGADKNKKDWNGLTPEKVARNMSKKLGVNRVWDLTLDALR